MLENTIVTQYAHLLPTLSKLIIINFKVGVKDLKESDLKYDTCIGKWAVEIITLLMPAIIPIDHCAEF